MIIARSRGVVLVAGVLLLVSGCSRCSRSVPEPAPAVTPEVVREAPPVEQSPTVLAPSSPSITPVEVSGESDPVDGNVRSHEGRLDHPPQDGKTVVLPEDHPAALPTGKNTREQLEARGQVPMGEPPTPRGFSAEERRRHEEYMERGKRPLEIPSSRP